MPSPPRPKSFVAARDFTHARRRHQVGDPIEDRRLIAHLLRRNKGFIRSIKPAPAETPADQSAATPPAESLKED